MQELINRYLSLPSSPTNSGWYTITCPLCSDYKPRAGFRFDGTKSSYHCFNCGHAASYDEDTKYVSDEFAATLDACGVPKKEIDRLYVNALGSHRPNKIKVAHDPIPNPVYEIEMPAHFTPLSADDTDIWAQIAIEYLASRGVDFSLYNFFISKGCKTPSEVKWHKRVICPCYRNGKLIFYQGRDLTGKSKLKYMNESSIHSNSVVLYGYDELLAKKESPLFITEGIYDAISLNGVALIGNELSQRKIDVINTSVRKKVYIPDLCKTGLSPALAAIRAGWSLALPEFGGCKDVNEAILKYGSFYVNMAIGKSICSGFEAKIRATQLCTGK